VTKGSGAAAMLRGSPGDDWGDGASDGGSDGVDADDGDGDGLPTLGSVHVDPTRVTHLSWKPRAYLYRGFLKKAECDYIR